MTSSPAAAGRRMMMNDEVWFWHTPCFTVNIEDVGLPYTSHSPGSLAPVRWDGAWACWVSTSSMSCHRGFLGGRAGGGGGGQPRPVDGGADCGIPHLRVVLRSLRRSHLELSPIPRPKGECEYLSLRRSRRARPCCDDARNKGLSYVGHDDGHVGRQPAFSYSFVRLTGETRPVGRASTRTVCNVAH